MGISHKNEDCQRQSGCQSTPSHRPQETDCLKTSRCFPKSARILKSRHFQSLLREKNRITGSCISIDYRKGRTSCPRLGITVSKKFGKAHDRNWFKRCVREVFRHSCHFFPKNLEINITPRFSSKNINKTCIVEDIMVLLSKINATDKS